MDDKVFNLLEKMYSELTSKIDGLSNEMKEVKGEVREVKNQVTRIEVEHGKKLDALFDGYKQNTEAIKELSGSMETLVEKVDSHDIKIQVIQGGKRA